MLEGRSLFIITDSSIHKDMPCMAHLHEPLVVERDPDGEGVEEQDQAYSAEHPTDNGHWECHLERLLTSR